MNWFRSRLAPFRVDVAEAACVGNILAVASAIFAVASLLAIYIDPAGAAPFHVPTNAILGAYFLYSIGVLLFVQRGSGTPQRFTVVIQIVDVAWISMLVVLTGGVSSPFAVFFTFALVAAAYRWGFWETVWSGALIGFSYFAPAAYLFGAAGEGGEPNRLAMRAGFLMLMSVFLGYLAQNEKRLRRENALIARAVAKAKAEFGFTQSMQGALGEIRTFYDAAAVIFVAEELATGNIYVLGCGGVAADFGRFLQLDPEKRSLYFFSVNGEAWHSVKKRSGIHNAQLLDAHGKLVPDTEVHYPEEFVTLHQFESLCGVKVAFGQELAARLFILDPRLDGHRMQEVAFVQRIGYFVTPTLYNVYLWRRLKAKAGAIERARVARELHDGVIQALIGLEMQLDVMKHQAASGHSPGASKIESVQQLLRNQIQDVRGLMNQLRHPRFEPSEMIHFMAEQVDKFTRETGISAKFVAETDKVSLPPEVCREVVQILQEALINVRKHSGATHLLVRLSGPDEDWNLAIIDDGCGFGFEGRLSHSQLDAQNLGPLVIKERVRLIHGELEIESLPGHGARLDIRLPKRIYA